MAFQFRRGTDAERQSITPKSGEPLFVTDTGKVYVGNGTTQGGIQISASVSDDEAPSLGGNLDLNNNSIIGTGNININGNITATGTINLGDGVEDNIVVGGVISSNLIPNIDGVYDLGSSDFYWRNGYFEEITVDGELSINRLLVDSIQLNDSTTVFDGETSSLFVESIIANNIDGELKGSVLSDDSTILINAETNAGSFNNLSTEFLFTSTIESDLGSLLVSRPSAGRTDLAVAGRQDRGSLYLIYQSNDEDLSNLTDPVGTVFFTVVDTNGTKIPSLIAGRPDSISLQVDPTGEYIGSWPKAVLTGDGYFGINKDEPEHPLDVVGEIVTDSFVQFGSFTTSERDNLTAVNGMVLYNVTEEKFQGYQNGSWINLDGT